MLDAGFVRRALARQARQSALAAVTAALGLLFLAPIVALLRLGVALAKQREVPLGEVPALMMLSGLNLVAIDEMVNFMLGARRRRLCLLLGVAVVQVAMWTTIVAAAKRHGVRDIGAAGLWIGGLVHVFARPVAVMLRPRQNCSARLRRTVRELKVGSVRVSAVCAGMSVVLYVYLTVFTQLLPLVEVLVMGLAMPLLQTVCMSLLSRLVRSRERKMLQSMRRGGKYTMALENKLSLQAQVAGESASSTAIEDDGSLAASPTSPPTSALQAHGAALAEDEAALVAAGAAARGTMRGSLMMVLVAEVMYAAGAFVALALAKSDQAFFLSLISMVCVEVANVLLHVKARKVMSRVAAVSNVDTFLQISDASRLRQWLLFQELGEKAGVLVALGFLAADLLLDQDKLSALGLTSERLAWRGPAMVLMQLVGDVAKDAASQVLGLVAAMPQVDRVELLPRDVFFTALATVCAGVLVQCGLALGT